MGDEIVLSYGDSLLRTRDVMLLQTPNWLNDNIIGFAFEFFSKSMSDALSERVVFIAPEVTQLIKLGELPLEIFLEPLNLIEKDYLFLAINDQKDCDEAGGSHWSLLFYSRSDSSYLHFDSSSGSNFSDAQKVAKKIHPFLDPSVTFPGVNEGKGGRQSNGYDCGMFLILHAEALLETVQKGGDIGSVDSVKQNEIGAKRRQWTDLIVKLSLKSPTN